MRIIWECYKQCHLSSGAMFAQAIMCSLFSALWYTVLRISLNSCWKTGLLKSFFGCLNYFGLSSKEIFFSVINTKFACFPFNHVPIYRELGHPSGDLWGHVGSPNQWVTFGDWATSYPQHWIHKCPCRVQCGKLGHSAMPKTCENWIGLINIGPVNIVLIFNTENVKSVFSLVSHKCVRLHNGNTMFVF